MPNTEEYMDLSNHRDVVKRTGTRPVYSTRDLFVIGWVSYRDESNAVRTTGFCQRYNFLAERFERVPDPDYEYGDHG